MLELRGLSTSAGSFELAPLSLSVQSGSCHILLGPTGCGKTVLLESVIGLRNLTHGQIRIDDREVTRLPVGGRGMSYVPQDLALFPHLTVEGNIFYGPRIRRLPESSYRALATELVDVMGLGPLLSRPIDGLSGGERQRVALVRALVAGDRVLLLDEPFSALHMGLRQTLWLTIRELIRRFELTVLMVTHNIEEAFFLGDRLTILIDGVAHQTGARREVYERPATLAVAGFLGVRNLFEGEVRQVGTGSIVLHCPALATDLSVTPPRTDRTGSAVVTGGRVMVGIRSELVLFRFAGAPRANGNVLAGTVVSLHDKGASLVATFVTAATGTSLVVDIGHHAAGRLGLAEGLSVEIVLKPEHLFLAAAPALCKTDSAGREV